MKKRRLILMIVILFVLCFILSLSSALFQLQCVKIKFCGENIGEKDEDEIISSVDFKYGQLLFGQPKAKYVSDLEQNNPNLCVKSIEAVFPNTLLITVEERVGRYYFCENNKTFVLDKDYKIIEIGDRLDFSNYIKMEFISNINVVQTYFEFFSISSFAYDVGQFLSDNNLVFSSIGQLFDVFDSFYDKNYVVFKISFKNVSMDIVDMTLYSNSPFGIKIEIKNILNKFDRKILKAFSALATLNKKEKIKTTYGTLRVDDNINCFWLEK